MAERSRSASVRSSLHMPWHNWRARALLGLFVLAFQFWPSTTETPVTTTSRVTGWSLNHTVVLRSVSRSTSDAVFNCRSFTVRGYGVYGIMVLITTWTTVSPSIEPPMKRYIYTCLQLSHMTNWTRYLAQDADQTFQTCKRTPPSVNTELFITSTVTTGQPMTLQAITL